MRSRPQSTSHIYLIHAHSPLHAGVGEGTGAINLPTARERASGLPLLPGSSVKGVLRDLAESEVDRRQLHTAFGPPAHDASAHRGGLVFTDALLLALPVRSLYGTFAWVTAPDVLRRLTRDADEAGASIDGLDAVRRGSGPRVTQSSVLGDPLILEELTIGSPRRDPHLTTLADSLAKLVWPDDKDTRTFFRDRLCIIPDDDFTPLHHVATEVRTRVKIDDDTGTAAGSGPWSEEFLPTESLLFGLVLGRRTAYIEPDADGKPTPVSPDEPLGVLAGLLTDAPVLRFGGKSTVGAGRARLRVSRLMETR